MPSNEPLSPAQRQFGAAAAAYAVSPVHRDGPDLPLLVEAAELTGREQVLDLGCGAGHTTIAVAKRAGSVVALDVTAEMLAVAQQLAAEAELANVSFRQASAAELPFADRSFDVVVSRFAAHHFDDPPATLADVRRVLRPGGRLVLVDTVSPEDAALDTFFNAAELLRDPSHVRNWRVSEWERFLREAGFTPETLLRSTIALDGASWVARSQTAPERVAAVRTLFAGATVAARTAFALQNDDPWGWTIPMALLRGRRLD